MKSLVCIATVLAVSVFMMTCTPDAETPQNEKKREQIKKKPQKQAIKHKKQEGTRPSGKRDEKKRPDVPLRPDEDERFRKAFLERLPEYRKQMAAKSRAAQTKKRKEEKVVNEYFPHDPTKRSYCPCTGVVLDAETKKPIAGAQVMARASVVYHSVVHLSRTSFARFTFSKISSAFAVHLKDFGSLLC